MPEPDSVILIPASAPAVIAVAGVKENVAVVAVALTEEESVTARPVIAPHCTACARTAKMANFKISAFISMELTLLCNLEA